MLLAATTVLLLSAPAGTHAFVPQEPRTPAAAPQAPKPAPTPEPTPPAAVPNAARGATHWAYQPVRRPALPPGVDAAGAIDALLAPGIAQRGLTPAAPASRHELLRRVTLDLIGLPPTPEELAAFAADPAPDAYERVVDRLLASPHYGERWATPWLDLARYSDTNGFNFDQPRSMWKYRDWVIGALNRDLPFDTFTILQLAGDQVEGGGEDGAIATGFHRNTMLNDEGGVDPDEARWERLLDRASTTSTTWLGATLHCAQCHDHKYDPIAQRDFFGMVAFFEADEETTLELPTADERARRAALQQQAEALVARNADAKAIAAAKKAAASYKVTSTLTLRQRPGAAATTTLRLRGAYDARGDEVIAAAPSGLGLPWTTTAPMTRLALARWLVDPRQPLTPRVHSNRLWGELFGAPLVRTPEDFGTQTPAPEQLELLDWLASEFVRLGWSQKRLLRAMVLSAAYRRSAVPGASGDRAVDPDNLAFARAARVRLPAEHLRDLQLAASGLLDATVGGPSVFPLQADVRGVIPTNKADLRWTPSAGGDRHRRGIYTFWRRTATFVQFGVFDAPSREVCVAQRQRTNTPLQALTGLNDPAAWDAAQALGKRMQAHAGDERSQLAHGFVLCTSRSPTAAELDLLQQALAAEPEGLRWTLVANALLNLDEAVTR